MDDKSENVVAGIFLAALLLGGILLLTRKTEGVSERPLQLNRRISSSGKLQMVEDAPGVSKPGRRYQNLEQWHAKWSPDGDECWVDIKRDAVQS